MEKGERKLFLKPATAFSPQQGTVLFPEQVWLLTTVHSPQFGSLPVYLAGLKGLLWASPGPVVPDNPSQDPTHWESRAG